jgi:transposase
VGIIKLKKGGLAMTKRIVYVGIDIAKRKNDVVVALSENKKRRFTVANKLDDYEKFLEYLQGLDADCQLGLEASGNYHRPLAYYLESHGIKINLISSIALARTREAMHNSWDKNDPKDAHVIVHMLRTGLKQIYYDSLRNGIQDLEELSKTHYQVSLQKMRVQHSLLTHYLPLYFPEADKYFCSTRAEWFSRVLHEFPSPHIISKMSEEQFIKDSWKLVGRKVNKTEILKDFYKTASRSIGLPVSGDSSALDMLRLTLKQHNELCLKRALLEQRAEELLKDDQTYRTLKTVPGIGPILALTIMAETGDFKRFKHHRQYLKFRGLICQQVSLEITVVNPNYLNVVIVDCAVPSGWRQQALCECARIPFVKNIEAILKRIQIMPILNEKL